MGIIAAEESEGECSHICVFIPCSDITSEIQDLEVLTSGGGDRRGHFTPIVLPARARTVLSPLSDLIKSFWSQAQCQKESS